MIVLIASRLQREIGSPHATERIGLTDQAREFRQWIAFAPGRCMLTTAMIVVISGKRSVLISISHRDDASPSGKPPTPNRSYKRTGSCRMPPRVPNTRVNDARFCLTHFDRGIDAENGQPGCQNRNNALNQSQPRLCNLCIIIDNEA